VDTDAPELTRQALRLALSAELTRRAARCVGERIPADADLEAVGQRLVEVAAPVERAHRLRFAPAFPGVTGGVEQLRAGRRIVLACTVLDEHAAPAAVAFTTLIAGHAPQVAVAPASAPIPAGWTALA
jgi:hypothetical protein